LIFSGVISCGLGHAPVTKKLLVIGIDGMDPQLLERFTAEGKMPNFSALAARGSFTRLSTSIPPQSPVAWSNLITGMDPGGHGIFDFIHREPATLAPYLSTSRVEPPKHILPLGSWRLPLTSGATVLLRHGKSFWEILDEHGVPAVIYRMPANFPPVKTHARTFSGMGTPDLLGTYGTFSYYTDDLFVAAGPVNGGHVYPVKIENGRVQSKLYGPYNTLRKGEPQAALDFTVFVDPAEPVAKIVLPDQEIFLREGEWSPWVRVEFELLPVLASVRGICRFYLKETHPGFKLYVSPVNLDPADPALPLSTPANYSRELDDALGPFHTLGIAEDTKALSGGYLNDDEYLQQARLVLDEQLRAFDYELARFRSGMLFFYFSSLDLNSHMFWRTLEKDHPAGEAAQQHANVLEQFYIAMDLALGKALARVDDRTTLLVLSDHGFAPYTRSFNLNTWLLQKGYLALKPDATPGAGSAAGDFFKDVDWSRTRAYGLGLNGLYLNLSGREKQGIVHSGAESDALLADLVRELLAVRDPASSAPVITRVDRATEIYSGPYVAQAPELLIGYNRGYRAGWGTVLGGISAEVFEDNLDPWSGDHCMDYTLVPGVLLSNRKLAATAPSLLDIAPTILGEFGVAKPPQMKGASVFEKRP
jgi:predicted AlkP superfamily phosphohydrolase/phosphomutase